MDQFIEQVPYWHGLWAETNASYFSLEERLTKKATSRGYLEISDLVEITYVLGNPHNVRGRMQRANAPADVVEKTRNAMRNLDNPVEALKCICSIKYWGLTYGSKTLRCMCPREYGALDSVINDGVDPRYLPSRNSYEGYADFIHLCKQITDRVVGSNTSRADGLWFIADIEVALFQFLWGRTNRLLYQAGFVHRV